MVERIEALLKNDRFVAQLHGQREGEALETLFARHGVIASSERLLQVLRDLNAFEGPADE